MNFKILLKSFRIAFRARRRVISFIVIYSVLFITVSRGIAPGGDWMLWVMAALIVATVYAILISQFRRKDIAILKCISWNNADVTLLLIGEVVLVSLAAFLAVFQVSVEVLGLSLYVFGSDILAANPTLEYWLRVPLDSLFLSLIIITFLQLPGLLLAQWRAMSIPPMRALREE
ncbi:MAG: hypothetical protein ACFFAY_06780 [Promethearchaeota archaeon]